jgi:MYXO-CTERM domain-containing protein
MDSGRRRLRFALLGSLLSLLPTEAWASRVVYVNTDPVTVIAGGTNTPASNTIAVGGYTQTNFVGWQNATEEHKQELLYLLKETTLAYDVIWTLDRPLAGDYDMIVFGDQVNHTTAFGNGCSPQVGIRDCSDAMSVSIGFLFWGCLEANKWYDPHRVAFSVLGAAGYAWGFENVGAIGQVMGGYSNFGLQYGQNCTNITGAAMCPHNGCPVGQQNGADEMNARFGLRVDDGPPQLVVIEPEPGTFSGTFDLVIEIIDGFGGLSAQLTVPELDLPPAFDDQWPFRWDNITLPPGPYNLEIQAFDANANSTMIVFPLCIDTCNPAGDGDGDGDPGDGDGDGDGDPGDGDGDGDGDNTDDSGEDTTDAGPSPEGGFVPLNGEEAEVGCACSTDTHGRDTHGHGLGGVLALLGLTLLRRRHG